MKIAEVLTTLDEMLTACNLPQAEQYLTQQIALALSKKEYGNAITLYNEQIGFYRDCGKFELSLQACQHVIELIQLQNLENTREHATTMLNIANAYRASGNYAESFQAYDTFKKIYDSLQLEDIYLLSSYYNNLALLHQEVKDYESASECLLSALDLVKAEHNPQRIAISETNLATTYVQLNRIQEAEQLLQQAMGYFKGLTPSDFHYSAALCSLGDVNFKKGNYEKSLDLYEMALSETELHMGRNNFYDIIQSNIETVKFKLGNDKIPNGMELSRKYFELFGLPMIEKNFAKYQSKIVCGLVGEGSDCFGFDDALSKDHDYGPGFCMWVEDEVYDAIGPQLEKAYQSLPQTFFGYERVKSLQSQKRVGVFSATEFYCSLLGVDKLPTNVYEWMQIDIERLAVATNGEIFTENENIFTLIREDLIRSFPDMVLRKNIAQQAALIAQSGQYNFQRMLSRNDFVTALTCFTNFSTAVLRLTHLLENRYYPYYKWLFKSSKNNAVKEVLQKASHLDIQEWYQDIIVPICALLNQSIKEKYGLTNGDDYMDTTAREIAEQADELLRKEQLAEEIAKNEFVAFDQVQNEGGRANCQDDWKTFSIMRKSQYLTWTVPMLEQYLSDFQTALENGRNLITEKYARMMYSTAPEEYAAIKKQLPEIESDTWNMCNAICEIQVGWMENFAEKFPNLSTNARIIHTSEDTAYDTSYETYLRGELLTYSRTMLSMYAGFIVDLCKQGKNLAELTMENTVKMYGYHSLEDADRKYSTL